MGQLEANSPTRAVELRQLLGHLGPSFVKVGQALSSRPDLLPQVYLEVGIEVAPYSRMDQCSTLNGCEMMLNAMNDTPYSLSFITFITTFHDVHPVPNFCISTYAFAFFLQMGI